MRVDVTQSRDETGEFEEFTWDLIPLVESEKTLHLDRGGLPKVGTRILPGMIVVGKVGKTKSFDATKWPPNSLEIHGLALHELKAKCGSMFVDGSFYATSAMSGIVEKAYMEQTPTGLRAVVEILPVGSSDRTITPAPVERPREMTHH